MKSTEIYIGSTWSTEDKAFFIGQALVGWETKARDRRYDFSHQLLEMAKEHRPDLVFLSVVAHPQGKEVAFKYFSEFCDMIPAERMCEILKLHSDRLREFIEMFEQHELPIVKDYVRYLRRDLPYERGQLMNKHFVNRLESKHVEPLRRINRAFVEGKTPWTRKVQIEAPNSHGNMGFVSSTIDAWEIWGLLDDKTLNPFVIDAIDPDAWNEATAFENLYRGLSVSGLTKRLAEYFRLEAEHTIIELMSSPWRNMAIAGYVARKRDEESVNAYRR